MKSAASMGTWLYLLQVYGFENLLFYGTFIITTVAFWTVSCGSSTNINIYIYLCISNPSAENVQAALFYLSLDVYGWLPSVRKYKVQPGANNPIDKTKVR